MLMSVTQDGLLGEHERDVCGRRGRPGLFVWLASSSGSPESSGCQCRKWDRWWDVRNPEGRVQPTVPSTAPVSHEPQEVTDALIFCLFFTVFLISPVINPISSALSKISKYLKLGSIITTLGGMKVEDSFDLLHFS